MPDFDSFLILLMFKGFFCILKK